MSRIKVGIVGASGYTGSELVRILTHHADVDIEFITSESHSGKKFSDLHSAFTGICDLELIKSEQAMTVDVDTVFLALPHKVSMKFAPQFLEKGCKVIDLSGDFRIKDQGIYEKWYQVDHTAPGLIPEAAYGLPELFKQDIQSARLVANPGCYPTSVGLAAAPLVKAGKIDQKQPIIADSKSGTTGAGVKPSTNTHYSSMYGNFFAYKMGAHRHMPEIQQTLRSQTADEVSVLFTPHLLPVDRGILSTVYSSATAKMSNDELAQLFRDYYKGQPFVRILNQPPQLKNVRGSNYCDIFPLYNEETNTFIVLSAIDNLVKGAAGQAVHNMNLMYGLKETTGLEIIPLNP